MPAAAVVKRLKTMVLPPDRRVFHQFPCGERTMAKGACCTTRHSDYYLSRWYAMMACSSHPSNFFAGLDLFHTDYLGTMQKLKSKEDIFHTPPTMRGC
jgi:phosphodiesterase/alkaline phosphatase D-like protein